MSSAVIRQIENGWIVVFYVAGVAGTDTTAATEPLEYEQYYNDLPSATAGIATVL
jgi:hypothetical protein